MTLVGLPMISQNNVPMEKVASQDSDTPETFVFSTSIEALAPSPIFHNASTIYFVLDEILLIEELDLNFDFEFFEVFSENLIRILFNFIIAPNAP